MDPITQGALGAVAATCFADASRLRVAAALGWAGGMLADVDIFIRSASDPLLNIEYHRHFTHALVFIPIGGLLCAAALGYLVLGGVQRERASQVQEKLAESRGHRDHRRATVKPSLGNLLLWRSIYMHEGRYYVDAIRVGVLTDARVYPGSSVPGFDTAAAAASLPEGSTLANDLRRFAHFSDDYVARLPDREYFLTDVRYSALPHSLTPLWGIDLADRGPDEHVAWVEREFRDPALGSTLWSMVRGRPLEPAARS